MVLFKINRDNGDGYRADNFEFADFFKAHSCTCYMKHFLDLISWQFGGFYDIRKLERNVNCYEDQEDNKLLWDPLIFAG